MGDEANKVSPVTLMGVLIQALTALTFPTQWVNPDSLNVEACPFSGQTVFSTVKAFDLEDWQAAFNELYAYQDRVAFVVRTDEEQFTKIEGKSLWTFFSDTFTILCCDRSHVERPKALTGDSSVATPGINFISHVLITGIMGEPVSGYIFEPMDGEVFAMRDVNRADQWGRVGWRQVMKLHGSCEGRALSEQAMTTFSRSSHG